MFFKIPFSCISVVIYDVTQKSDETYVSQLTVQTTVVYLYNECYLMFSGPKDQREEMFAEGLKLNQASEKPNNILF